jgi:phage tail-like protein
MSDDAKTANKNFYKVTIGRDVYTDIQSVSGLNVEVSVEIESDAGSPDGDKATRGKSSGVGYLTIEAISNSAVLGSLWEWYEDICDTKPGFERKTIKIDLLNREDERPLLTWKLNNAWPCKWYGPELDLKDKGFALEKVVFVYDTINRIRG